MKFIFDSDTWQEIFGSIRKSKLRTFITILGVFWGVFLFITLLGASKGMENGFDKQFQGLATNSFFLWGGKTSIPSKGFQRGNRVRLKTPDITAVMKSVPEVSFISPRTVQGAWGSKMATVKYNNNSKSYKMFGDFPLINDVKKVELLTGRFINYSDIHDKRKICIIGELIVDELFESRDDVVGKFIDINGSFFKVVGVYKEQSNSFEGEDSIYIPFSTYSQLYNMGQKFGWMVISVRPEFDIVAVEQKVKKVLKKRHGVHPDDERAFGSFNLGEMYSKLKGFIKGMQFLTWFVGISTLLAGIIAIGSILLITVKERTKEIGIRRALGATPSKIRGQIVLESVFLTLIAGALGIIFSGVVLWFLNYTYSEGENFPFVNPTVNVIVAIGAVLALVIFGSLIGLIPAQRAISIKPIEALRED